MTGKQTGAVLLKAIAAMAAVCAFSNCGGNTAVQTRTELFGGLFPSATATHEIAVPEDILARVNLRNLVTTEITGPSGRLGYAVESDGVSRSGPFRIRTLVDTQGAVKQAVVLTYPWDRGRDVRNAVFTRQFEGKGPHDPIRIGQDIVAVTGATISCTVMTEGVCRSVALAQMLSENRQ